MTNISCRNKKRRRNEPVHEISVLGWGTLIFSHIRRLGLFWGVHNSEFQYFWGFQKNEYFFGYEDFVDIFLGSSQIWASLRVISMHFRVFFKVNVQNWDIILGC